MARPTGKATVAPGERLRPYLSKRDFSKTPEPTGGRPSPAGALRFLVQKHAASHLHFDFRLELGGVLLSWAVPKGPSWTPTVRRLARQTEDHPLDYGDFEGVIPEGEYGGGTVMLWDRGTWTPEGDPEQAMRAGRLTFELHGERMKGRWHLVRTAGRSGKTGDDHSWLLFKGRDAEANDEREEVAARDDGSVSTGRTMAEIARQKDRVWSSNRTTATAKVATAKVATARVATAKVATAKVARDEGTSSRKAARKPSARVVDPGLRELVGRIPTGVSFTNLDKVLYPAPGLTKAALVAYYAIVAKAILPHVAGRPLTLVRCPEGAGSFSFFQKHAKKGVQGAIRRVPIREENGDEEELMVIDDLDGLFACVQLGALELHVWGSHIRTVEKADRIVFDLDPDPTVGWSEVVHAAKHMKLVLAELGLETFVMTTGGKGLHVVAPLAPRLGWDATKEFTKDVVERVAEAEPGRYTTSSRKASRQGKIFLDYLRNGRGATAVCPYSTRSLATATVATPIAWAELDAGVTAADFTVPTLPGRLDALKTKDPWAGYFELRQQITAAARRAVRSGAR